MNKSKPILDRLSYRSIWISMFFLGAFLSYYIYLSYERQADQMEREATYLFDNAVKQVEGKLLTEMIFAQLDTLNTHSWDSIEVHQNGAFKVERRFVQTLDIEDQNLEIERFGDLDSLYGNGEDSIKIMVGVFDKDLDTQQIISLVEKEFKKNLNKADLNVNYTIIIEDSLNRNNLLELISQSDSTGAVIEERSTLDIRSQYWTIIQHIWPDIALSVFLFLSIGLAFYLLVKRLESEKEISTQKNEFVQNITHELKTPLSALSLAVEAIESVELTEDKKKNYLGIIGKESHRLNHLVDEILNVQYIEEGNIEMELSPILLDKYINEKVEEWKYQYNGLSIDVGDLNSQQIMASSKYLNKALNHLMDNAVKYNDKELCTIHIYGESKKDFFQLHFKDNGPGIPTSAHKDIFKKFYRVATGNTHNIKGHGLGMYFAKQMLLEMGGDLNLEPGSGGAHFILKLLYHD